MIRLFALGAAAIVLTGCADQSAFRAPEVDMRGVDAQRYANDLHECTEIQRAKGFVAFGTISACLTQRGYRVTMPYS